MKNFLARPDKNSAQSGESARILLRKIPKPDTDSAALKKFLDTVQNAFLPSGVPASLKLRQGILFLLNLLLIGPFIVRNFTLPFGISALVLLFLTALAILKLYPDDTRAVICLPLFFVLDGLLLAAAFLIPMLHPGLSFAGKFSADSLRVLLHITDLPDSVGRSNILQSVRLLGPLSWILLLVAGIVLFALGGRLGSLGGAIAVEGLVYMLWGGGNVLGVPIPSLSFRTMLVASLVINGLWLVLMRCAAEPDGSEPGINRIAGLVLALVWALISVLWQDELLSQAGKAAAFLDRFGQDSLPWRKAVFLSLCFQVSSVIFYDHQNGQHTTDSEVMSLLGWGILLLKAVLSRYLPFSWLALLVYFVVGFVYLSREIREGRLFGFSETWFYPVLFLSVFALYEALCSGLWANAVLCVLFAIAEYVIWPHETTLSRTLRILLAALCICGNGLAFALVKRFNAQVILMLACEGILFMAAAFAVNLPVLSRGWEKRGLNICLFSLFLLLITLTAARGGVRIHVLDVDMDDFGTYAYITVQARGRGNSVDAAQYAWDESLEPEQALGAQYQDLPLEVSQAYLAEHPDSDNADPLKEALIEVKDKRLLLQVTDSNGIRTNASFWFPLWKENWLLLNHADEET